MPIETHGARTRPRRALGLNRPLLTTLPTLGSARPGAASRTIFGATQMTGFHGPRPGAGGNAPPGSRWQIRERFGENPIFPTGHQNRLETRMNAGFWWLENFLI